MRPIFKGSQRIGPLFAVLTVFPDTISFAQIYSTFTNHPLINAEVNFSSNQYEKRKSIYSFKKADVKKIAERFS